MRYAFVKCLLTILLGLAAADGMSQPGSTIELDKPKVYQNRTLTSEKTGQKKFRFTKHVFQNMITHYNYYFNANNRLNEVVERAKLLNKDDYTQLLSYYNYSTDATAKDGDLDSIIYKCNAGILLHDLRNDWIDNMYLLLGETYFYRKNFDSAAQVFQYINYAFSPREDVDYFTPIGSNAGTNKDVFSISTKEDRDLWQKMMSKAPSRNDALLWQARNYTEAGNYAEAVGLLEILRSDPLFPDRLKENLHEALGYWFYKQNIYDSAAWQLSQALSITANRQEKARREFLTAQLYLLAHNNELAIDWYNKAAQHAVDPVMEVYANLNSINAYTTKSDSLLQQKINSLQKLARKERYAPYRDIVYYALASIVLQRNDYKTAKQYLRSSIAESVNNPQQKSKSFLMLGDVFYTTRDFINARNCYDSVSAAYIMADSDKNRLALRQPALKVIAQNLQDINAQDSLQAIAALPKAQQDAIIKKELRQLRRQQGLKDEDNTTANINPAIKQTNAADLFSGASAASGEWYFNNTTLKASGYNSFRQQWGNRPNVDNWRRQSAVEKAFAANRQKAVAKADSINNAQGNTGENGLTFNALYKKLPTTPAALQASNERIINLLFKVGQAFEDKLEDYPNAIDYYDSLNVKFPGNINEEQAWFNLYYCYNKQGMHKEADSVKALLANKYNKGKYNNLLKKGPAPVAKAEDAATMAYNNIYNMFIEGRFEDAKREKSKADSIYGNSHWTPQLLFIEAVYYVSRREDSAAINRLNNLSKMYPTSPMAARANTMAAVLRRRTEIEGYLTNLQVTRYKDEDTAMPVTIATNQIEVPYKAPVKADSAIAKPAVPAPKPTADTIKTPILVNKSFEFVGTDTQYVSILLDKVDAVFTREAANAFNRHNAVNNFALRLKTTQLTIDDRYNLVLIGPFANAAAAMDYIDKTRPVTASRILPWLTTGKYNYTIISNANLTLLKQNKDVAGYEALLQKVLPGKF
jgi:tetratricopeptide (TPR) repeat protein